MRGDFSRIRFIPGRQYTAVLQQQGRVALDADANEQAAIYEYLGRTETVDVIGEFGAPIHDAGFAITIDPTQNEILIGPGRYYVEGLMCENPASVTYDSQPYLINPGTPGRLLLQELARFAGKAVIQVFLEVWQRLVTPLDDPCLREPALGQADTTDRLQTVWRVVASLAEVRDTKADCCAQMYGQTLQQAGGELSAQTSGASAECGCEPVATAGYRGLENQLYRVEIHDGGNESAATFKWSRENGSVVAAIRKISGATLWVDSLGPDANLGFQPDQWVEITDDSYLFGQTPNQPGNLYQIQSIDPAHRSLTMTTTVLPVDTNRNARVRRWDQIGATAGSSATPVSVNGWSDLENGIQVRFSPGAYNSGDYWTIPARTATGQIEWPPCGSDGAAFQPAQGVRIYRAPLACIHWRASKLTRGAPYVEDCRRFFSPLTELAATANQAVHVTDFSWLNDDVTTLDQLVANGITVTLDQAPSSPITGANFIVTLEAATPPARSVVGTISAAAGGLPSTILRAITILDSQITVKGGTVLWQLPFLEANPAQRATVLFIEELLLVGARVGWFARVRVRMVGRAIFASPAANVTRLSTGAQIFLDGQSFGQPALRADGSTPRIDLQLPSGNSEKASDFEGWFYLAPTQLLVSLTINHPTLQVVVDQNNVVTGVVDPTGAAGQLVTPQATVTVTYPAVADTPVSLSLSGASGVGSVASIPMAVMLSRNSVTAVVPISILSNPGANTTLTFTITASLNSALGPVGAQSANFTVAGVEPPIIIFARPEGTH